MTVIMIATVTNFAANRKLINPGIGCQNLLLFQQMPCKLRWHSFASIFFGLTTWTRTRISASLRNVSVLNNCHSASMALSWFADISAKLESFQHRFVNKNCSFFGADWCARTAIMPLRDRNLKVENCFARAWEANFECEHRALCSRSNLLIRVWGKATSFSGADWCIRFSIGTALMQLRDCMGW